MTAQLSPRPRGASLPARALAGLAAPRYDELCRRFPGPAAFIATDGRVRDLNDAAQPLLAVLDDRPGGLRGVVASVGAFARFEHFAGDGMGRPAMEVAVVPMQEGVLLLGRLLAPPRRP
jgi:hypothetical protein